MGLIDAKNLKRAIMDSPFLADWCKTAVNRIIDAQSTADMEPVVDAHWQKHDNGNKPWTCSACGSGCLLNYESDWCLSERCPHCGAKMDEEVQDE